MKKSKFATIVFIMIILCSCSVNSAKIENKIVGKVYQSSDGMDSDCKIKIKPTDYYQNIIFLNDSVFIKIVFSCCPSELDSTDYASTLYYIGHYKIDTSSLIMYYDTSVAIGYLKILRDSMNDNNSKHLTYYKINKIPLKVLKIQRLDCNGIPYFKQNDDEFTNDYLSPIDIPMNNFINDFKKDSMLEEFTIGRIMND